MYACMPCMHGMHACMSFLDHFWIIMRSFGNHFAIILGSLWGNFEWVWAHFAWLCDHIGMTFGSLWDDFGITLRSFGVTLVSIGVTLKSFLDNLRWLWSLFGPLGMLSELPWTPSEAQGQLVGSTKFCKKNMQISSSIRWKMERWSLKLKHQHQLFWESLKTHAFLMILRVRELRTSKSHSPALEYARTP